MKTTGSSQRHSNNSLKYHGLDQTPLFDLSKRFLDIFDSIKIGIIVATQENTVRAFNQTAQNLVEKYCEKCISKNRPMPGCFSKLHPPALSGASPVTCIACQQLSVSVWLTGSRPDLKIIVIEDEAQHISPAELMSLGLSQRQAEVMAWILAGKSNSEISTILGLSIRTVEKHVEKIFQHFGVETRNAATLHTLRALNRIRKRL